MAKKVVVSSDEEIRQYVNRDLEVAVSFINMIRNNPDVLKGLHDIIISRVRAEEDRAKLQPELEFNESDEFKAES